ncbi:hypothetical protein K1719_039898 [Acacia pycnantha]|nr:hypothetical protein K1719_039898 [Acacia pycnantha]
MEKSGRRRDEVWEQVTLLEGGRRWKCNDCGEEFAGGASRIRAHVNKVKGTGIRPCTGKANSNNDTEHNLLHSQGQIQDDAKNQERIQVGSSFVSNWDDGDLQMIHYVFECLSPSESVFRSPHLHLTQNQFITLKPGTWLDPSVIDIFVEILTESEKKKATPSNWYLPVRFSTAALELDEHNFKDFVHRLKMRENYIFDQESPEKVFIPVHIGQETHGHFYLYIFYLNKNVIEIWDNNFVAATDRYEATKKLLFAMEILFEKEKGALSNYKLERANDILSKDNGFDCGVFVINYMQQSDNYVKRNPLFQFDSQKEREDLALKLLTNDLNQEKQNLYDKARGQLYAQVEKQDGNERLRVDASETFIEVKYDDRVNRHDDLREGQIQANDAEDQERTQDLEMMKRYVFECLRPEDKVIVSPLSYLTREEFITLKPKTNLDSLVIDTFVEILTDIERKKKTLPLNWYLPVTFSEEALKGNVSYFLNFVHRQKITENYMSDLESCDKIFIPVHYGARRNGHFYLYIIHLKNKEIEIWDSLPNTTEAEKSETTEKLLTAMEKLFEKVAFTEFRRKMADDILSQPNGFDCGVFVINYMQQSDNYVKRDSSFQFDSQKEREDLALKLLNNDLNKEKKNLYDKARRHYAQVDKQDGNKRLRVDEKQDGNKRLRVDDKQDGNKRLRVVEKQDGNKRLRVNPSKEHFEDVGREMEAENDDSNEDDDDFDKEYDHEEDDHSDNIDGLENDLIGKEFQRYTKQITERIKDDKVSTIGVWGMGGSGKTALASHIYGKLLEEGDMKVIWVTMSQNSIYKLQKVIARSIKLDISDEYQVKRIARKLFQAFNEMKKCVLILDDVWDDFFLREVGFPMLDNRIKLILTTRIKEVCQGMGCDQKNIIEVRPLDMNDSRALFKKTMGSYEGLSLEVKRIALKVAYECEGLPLAIVRIATSMKGKKEVGEWSHMLECLKNLDNGQYEMDKWVFPVFRSSYDFLTKKLQRFFLYCALSAKGVLDKKANHLIRIFVYESIDETKKLRMQYDEAYNMLDRLKNHSMLEQNLRLLRMNKFLRVLAIGIAKNTGNKIEKIPDGTCLRCSQLSALLLNGCEELSYIPPLINLKCLMLLDLSSTAIIEAPLGLESLMNLRCLNLLHSRNLVIPALVISKLINLEYLELNVTTQVGIQAVLPGDMNELFIKKCHQDEGVSSVCRALSSGRKIERLDISWCKDVKTLCCLSYSCDFCSSSQLVGCLYLDHLEDLKDVVSPDALLALRQPELFSHLTYLEIQNCNGMKTLMTPKLLALFRNLQTIVVSYCQKMKEIVGEDGLSRMELGGSGDLAHSTITLPRLTSLKLQCMPQLNFVYRGVMLCPSLQTFSVYKCEELDPPRIVISKGRELPMEKTLTGDSWEIKTDSLGHDSDVHDIEADLSDLSSLNSSIQ